MATEDFQLLETKTRHLILKGATFMANPPPQVNPGAVPDPQKGIEIENILNALRKLEEAIEELKNAVAGAEPVAVPDPQKGIEIENVLNAHRKLKEATEELKKQRAVAEAELTELVKDLAAGPLSVETAIETYESWKGKYEALEANITALEKVLSVIDEHIKELKKN
jgi:chromosome segregation ATPase